MSTQDERSFAVYMIHHPFETELSFFHLTVYPQYSQFYMVNLHLPSKLR